MRKLINLLALYLIAAFCSCENAGDCFTSSGDEVEIVLEVNSFRKLEVNDFFTVVLKSGPEQRVILRAGENLLAEIDYRVEGEKLTFNDANTCDWVRSFDYPEIIISTPDLNEIRQNGSGVIRSEGVLSYPHLRLISENVSGDFELTINTESLEIVSNALNNYTIAGRVDTLTLGFFSGDGRFDGRDLESQHALVYHQGTNEMVVHATESLTGRILATGNLIYTKTIPPQVDVSIENRGKLIYRSN